MHTSRKIFCLLLITFPFAGNALADDNLWLGARAGTLGIGVEATWRPVPYLDLRAGLNRFDFSYSGTTSGVDYDAVLGFDSVYATANFRFPLSPMRITAGAYLNNNEIVMTSQDAPSFDIGGITYTSADVGSLQSITTFEEQAPYVGVGLDFRLFDKLGLSLDLGVLWQGSPAVALTADGLLAADPAFIAALEAERLQFEEDISGYKAWPVVSLGFNLNFF